MHHTGCLIHLTDKLILLQLLPIFCSIIYQIWYCVKKRFARLKNFLGHKHAFQLNYPFKQLHFNANPSHQNSILLLLPWYHKQMVFTKLLTKTMSALLKQEVNLLSHGPLCHGADTFWFQNVLCIIIHSGLMKCSTPNQNLKCQNF